MYSFLRNTSGFTLIELIVGMLIFSIGITGILAVLDTTMGNFRTSRQEIVAANLLREQVELIKNVRNTNVRNFIPFESGKFEGSATGFASGVYIVENNYTNTGVTIQSDGTLGMSPVTLSGITLSPSGLESQFSQTRLSLDAQGRYTHALTGSPTSYASYVIISPLQFENSGTIVKVEKNGKPQGYIIDARVIVNARGYKEYDLKTIITDWKK